MEITVGNIAIQVTKKEIKHLHVYVSPPLGDVTISAPLNMSDKAIESFAHINFAWIKKQQEKILQQPRQTKRQYVSGETYYILGKQYFMVFEKSNKRYFKFKGNEIHLGMKAESSVEQREKYVRTIFRKLLTQQLDKLIPKWENITGLYCDSYQIRYMTTRWGSCNPKNKTILLNLQLIEKPMECIEYVILHELTHLKVKNHGKDFIAILDSYMPNWKETKNYLNSLMINYDSYSVDKGENNESRR